MRDRLTHTSPFRLLQRVPLDRTQKHAALSAVGNQRGLLGKAPLVGSDGQPEGILGSPSDALQNGSLAARGAHLKDSCQELSQVRKSPHPQAKR